MWVSAVKTKKSYQQPYLRSHSKRGVTFGHYCWPHGVEVAAFANCHSSFYSEKKTSFGLHCFPTMSEPRAVAAFHNTAGNY
jgi:hypothetical protein